MKNAKRIIFSLILTLVFSLVLPIRVMALDNPDDLIKKIAPDGKNAVFKVKKPTSIEEGDFLINGYVNNLLQVEGYEITAGCYESPYTTCTIQIRSDDYQTTWENGQEIILSGWKGSYTINVTYDEPKSNSSISNYIDKLASASMFDPSTYYMVEDLSLINYYLTSSKSELWNPGAPGRALKYSTLNNITKGSDISYYIDVRAGMQDETLMFESAFGPMSIFYNGYSYGVKEEGIYLKRVIYVPEGTPENDYAKVAQKRIEDYLGNDTVKVTLGGDIDPNFEDPDYPIKSNGKYYNVKIGTRTYKFYILEGSQEKLVEPTYEAVNIESQIEITSKDSSIPLDTSISVNEVKNDTIKTALGTDVYVAYDISLYSDAKQADITKLENGKFIVNIPVPENLKDKSITVYYIDSEGKKEEHVATVKDGIASFETDHFSTYAIVEKTEKGKTQIDVPTINPKDEVKEITVGVDNAEKVKEVISNSIKKDTTLKDKVDAAIAAGKDVKTEVVVKKVEETKLDAAVKKEIDEKIKDNNLVVAQYLDLSIVIFADNAELGKVTELTEEITYTIAIPADLAKEGREFVVVRVHDGVPEILPTTMNDDGTLSFKTDRFSTYALAYKDDTGKAPQTSDNLMMNAFVMLSLLSGCAFIALKRKES